MSNNKIIHSLYSEESHKEVDCLHLNVPDNYSLMTISIQTFLVLEAIE